MSKGFDLPSNKHSGNTHDYWLAPQKNSKKVISNDMTQREKRDLIRSLKKEIKAQMNEILNSMVAPTMSKEAFAYYKCGVEQGIKVCIDILTEEEV